MNDNSFELSIPNVSLSSSVVGIRNGDPLPATEAMTREEKKYIFFLTIFFFLLGLPQGFFSGIGLMLMANGATMNQLGILEYNILVILGLAGLPYSLKIFVAPVIDTFYSRRIGKRRSYILPCFYLQGAIFLIMAISDY